MSDFINPEELDLPKNVKIEKMPGREYALVINRKSRIVMKDTESIILRIQRIRTVFPNSIVKLKTNAPVCSKAEAFLLEKGIEIRKF